MVFLAADSLCKNRPPPGFGQYFQRIYPEDYKGCFSCHFVHDKEVFALGNETYEISSSDL